MSDNAPASPSTKKITALILAASRRGERDPVAHATGVRQKSLAPILGVPMLSRVIAALKATPAIGDIYVSIEHEDLLPDRDAARFVPSQGNLAASTLSAVAAMNPKPDTLLITTGDHALLTPEMLAHFCAAIHTADVTVGMTAAATILARYPNGVRAFQRFKDGDASGCNLYGLRGERALAAAQVFAGGGQFGKKPWRLLRAFGLRTFVLHMLRRLTLDEAMARVGCGFGVQIAAVRMPFAEAAIDIDRLEDLRLAEEILRARALR